MYYVVVLIEINCNSILKVKLDQRFKNVIKTRSLTDCSKFGFTEEFDILSSESYPNKHN